MSLTGAAKVAGVMGWPVKHSKSPKLQGYWLDHYGIDGTYIPLPVSPEDFSDVFKALPKMGFAGVNVTVPHKESAFAACDGVSERARRMGAVNTVVFQPDGRCFGDNTDGYGFLENLKQGAPDWRGDQGPAVILGAGGAARGVIAALLDDGVPEVILTNRTRVRADDLAASLGASIRVVEWEDRSSILDQAALLVNTTSLGMEGQRPLEISLEALPVSAVVTDIVYVPLATELLKAAEARGNRVVDGIGMLLHQARPGFKAWFGPDPEVTDAQRAFVLKG